MGLLTLLSPPGALIKASSGPSANDMPERIGKSWQVDPFAYMESMSHRDKPSMLTYDQLRLMASRTDVINAIIQTRVNQVAAFAQPVFDRYGIGFTIAMRNGPMPNTKAGVEMATQISREIMSCGLPGMARDNFETFLRKFTRDSLVYDQSAAEVVPRRNGLPAFFEAVDASTIRIAAVAESQVNQLGYKITDLEPQTPFQAAMQSYQRDLLVQTSGGNVPAKYVQLINGTVRTTYTQDELYFGIRNPRTDLAIAGYGMSELEVLVGTITSYLFAEEYNRRIFSQGAMPRGLLNIKGEMTDQQLQAFKREWMTMISGIQNAQKTPVLNAEDIEYINLQAANKDMEYMQWLQFLVRIACFTPDTPVVMGDGSLRPIVEVQPGDMVRTHTGRVERVKNVQITSGKDRLIGIKAAGSVVRATPEHPFYVAMVRRQENGSFVLDDPRWVEAKDIVTDVDYLCVPRPIDDEDDDEPASYFFAPVTEKWEEAYEGMVYNLEVDGEHTYQVNHFAVHNCAIYLIDPAEINFDMPRGLDSTANPMIEANNEGKLKASRDRGLAPLLRFLQRAINEMYVYRIDPDFEFKFVGLDSRTIEQQQQIAIAGVSSYRTLNEVRAMEDLPPLENGDMPMNPVYVQLMQAQQQIAMQQQAAEQQAQDQEAAAEEADKQRDHEKDIAKIEAKADVESAKHQAKAAAKKDENKRESR